MARYRTIKPDFWTSEQVMECSPLTRLMFIGMWNYADDHGRLPLSPKSVKAQIFPSDDISVDTIRGMIGELSQNGLVRVYVVEGKEYLLITGWHHQKIDKPQKPKYPDPPPDNSPIIPRMVAPEGKGIEGKEGKSADAIAPPQPVVQTGSAEVEYYRRIKEIIGPSGGGVGKKLLDAKGGSVPLARAAVEQASTKQDPREYLGAIIRNRGSPDDEASRAGRSF